MIVTRITFELPNAGNAASQPAQSVRKLFNRIAGATVTDTKQKSNVEQMSLSELLYFALIAESHLAL